MPYYDNLPDLTYWRSVSEFRVIEAAMLFACIDPWDHEDFISGQATELTHSRRKLFKVIERSIATAISQGTLPAARAVASMSDYNGNVWSESFDPFKHSWPNLDTRESMVTRQSLFPWAIKVGLDYARPYPKATPAVAIPDWQPEASLVQSCGSKTVITPVAPTIQTPALLIENKPAYLDPSNELSPPEMRVAHDCWIAITANGNPAMQGKSAKSVAKKWLQDHRSEYDLSIDAIERLSKVVNWDKKGGAPKTP